MVLGIYWLLSTAIIWVNCLDFSFLKKLIPLIRELAKLQKPFIDWNGTKDSFSFSCSEWVLFILSSTGKIYFLGNEHALYLCIIYSTVLTACQIHRKSFHIWHHIFGLEWVSEETMAYGNSWKVGDALAWTRERELWLLYLNNCSAILNIGANNKTRNYEKLSLGPMYDLVYAFSRVLPKWLHFG